MSNLRISNFKACPLVIERFKNQYDSSLDDAIDFIKGTESISKSSIDRSMDFISSQVFDFIDVDVMTDNLIRLLKKSDENRNILMGLMKNSQWKNILAHAITR